MTYLIRKLVSKQLFIKKISMKVILSLLAIYSANQISVVTMVY